MVIMMMQEHNHNLILWEIWCYDNPDSINMITVIIMIMVVVLIIMTSWWLQCGEEDGDNNDDDIDNFHTNDRV
jgi:hypothetical protein